MKIPEVYLVVTMSFLFLTLSAADFGMLPKAMLCGRDLVQHSLHLHHHLLQIWILVCCQKVMFRGRDQVEDHLILHLHHNLLHIWILVCCQKVMFRGQDQVHDSLILHLHHDLLKVWILVCFQKVMFRGRDLVQDSLHLHHIIFKGCRVLEGMWNKSCRMLECIFFK